ncbi:hypothetical protein AAZX31_08G100200 [Glycine max]
MLALKPLPSDLSLRPSPATLAINRRRRIQFPASVRRSVDVKAAVSGGDKSQTTSTTTTSPSLDSKERKGKSSVASSGSGIDEEGIQVKAVVTIRKKMKENITEKLGDQWENMVNGFGQGIQIQLISEEIHPVTNSGKSVQSYVRGWLPKPSNVAYIVEYSAEFSVPSDFGCPGAVLVTNLHGKEFYLVEIIVHGFSGGPIFFPANTWIHSRNDNPETRIIFKNKAYLPSQTPAGIKDLRREDLLSIRGTQHGQRKQHDRIYDYATYNDLGNPDKDEELARPVLGGHEMPYPRRCRTGRPPTLSDPLSESRIEKPHPVYVPRDETFEEIKQDTFSAGRLKALFHNLLPSLAATLSSSDVPFKCFSDIDKLYIDGVVLRDEEQKGVMENLLVGKVMKQVLSAGESLLKYEIPAVIKGDKFCWLRDNEFARQTLAGVNPVNIELLKEFPIRSKLDPSLYGPSESAITKELLEQELGGMNLEQVFSIFCCYLSLTYLSPRNLLALLPFIFMLAGY